MTGNLSRVYHASCPVSVRTVPATPVTLKDKVRTMTAGFLTQLLSAAIKSRSEHLIESTTPLSIFNQHLTKLLLHMHTNRKYYSDAEYQAWDSLTRYC